MPSSDLPPPIPWRSYLDDDDFASQQHEIEQNMQSFGAAYQPMLPKRVYLGEEDADYQTISLDLQN